MNQPFLYDTDFFKSNALDDNGNLLKAKRAVIGEIRTWKGNRYQKTAQGWKPYKDKATAGKGPIGKSKKIEGFISKINLNAKNWGEATDEIVDLHKDMAERYNEMGGSYKFPETRSKTPSEWNKKHVAGVKKLLSKMKLEDIKYIEDNLKFEIKGNDKHQTGLDLDIDNMKDKIDKAGFQKMYKKDGKATNESIKSAYNILKKQGYIKE